MKACLLIIVLAALATGLWQGRELSRLEQRAASLGAVAAKTATSEPAPPTKVSRRDARSSLDAAAFVALLGKSVKTGTRPGASDRAYLRDQISAASGPELKQWAVALRDSDLPEELKKDILVSIAPRLAESDPRLAAELVLGGSDGNPFRSVMRAWVASDARAAAEWLEQIKPPRFSNPAGFDFPVMSLVAKVAADPRQPEALLQANGILSRGSLEELSTIQAPADFSHVLHQFAGRSQLPENVRLNVIGIALANHRDPAEARQMLLDAALSPDHFVRTAAVMIQEQDPAGRAAAVEWVRSLPEFPRKGDLLRVFSPAEE